MYFANRRLRCESSQEQRHELAKGKYLTIVTKVYAAAKVLQEAHYNAKFPGKDTTELYFAISTSDSHYIRPTSSELCINRGEELA